MQYLLAVAALGLLGALVVQTIRGRMAPRCCALPAEQDARLRDVSDTLPPADARHG